MPRQNPRKRHAALRRHAEARTAERKRQRDQTRADAIAFDAVLSRQAAPARARAAAPTDTVGTIRGFMRLANVGVHQADAVVALTRLLARVAPALLRVTELPWMLLLASQPWVRAPEAFRPPTGSARQVKDALATHLFSAHAIPRFLLRALEVPPAAVARVPVEDAWAVAVLAHVGAGGSLFAARGNALLPAPLTRRMCHRFLTAPPSFGPLLAMRVAQVTGAGGAPSFARVLMRTRLGRLRGPDPVVGEPFWHDVIAWMCRQHALIGLVPGKLDAVLAYIEANQAERAAAGALGPAPLLGRGGLRVLREAIAYRGAQCHAVAGELPASGLLPYVTPESEVVELRNTQQLALAATALGNCGAMYADLVRERKVALFVQRLRPSNEVDAMFEVSLGAHLVVQAKRAANQPLTQGQQEVLQAWATRNRLRVADAL